MYLVKLNMFIKENNNLLIKKSINKIIKNNLIFNSYDLYKVTYNDNGEIVGIDLDINKINNCLNSFIDILDNNLSNINTSYLDNYYDSFKYKDNIYYLLPLGMISDNPFIYNTGPKIILNYDLINVYALKIDINIKNYGINNALASTYIVINIDQNILKPVLNKITTYNYRFLLSSKIINGRISNYLGTNLNVESNYVSNI